ncbi:MAG: PorT family protein [Cytophagaceae bacterium]|jgi:hypothetical protein|nr:PorT family protein [Cytophagaceae bacterium]
MIKSIIGGILLGLTSLLTSAQVDIGIKGSVSLGYFSGRYDRTFTTNRVTRGGFQMGVYGTYEITNYWKLYSELSYAYLSAAFKYKDQQTYVTTLDIYKFHYIQLPILIQYHINDVWFVGTGIQCNFLLHASYHRRYNGDNEPSSNETPLINPVDIGWVLKGGYQINEQVSTGIHWYLGLTGLYKDNRDGLKSLRQQYIGFYITYSLYKN